MSKSKMVRGVSLLVVLLFTASIALVGCGTKQVASTVASTATPTAPAAPVTLIYAICQQNGVKLYTDAGLSDKYSKVKPNVKIEIEQYKDSEEMSTTLKIRNAAGEMPDLFDIALKDQTVFKASLEPLDDLACISDNLFVDKIKVDGKVLGLVRAQFNEYVWYWKSIFAEYNLSVPKTWDEYIKLATTIKDGKKYTPITMGGKDSWPDYPYNEFMPKEVSGNGDIWSTIASQDEPFSKGQPMYTAYVKIQQLYDAKVFGADPLGLGFDQSKALWLGKKAAMITCADWLLPDVKKATNNDLSDVGVFLLPVRDNATDKLNAMAVPGGATCVAKGKNAGEAKALLNWMNSDKDFYTTFTKSEGVKGASKSISVDADPVFAQAFDGVDINFVVDMPGNDDFVKLSAATKFDVKKIGQDMMAGTSFTKIFDTLNKSWKDARASLGIK